MRGSKSLGEAGVYLVPRGARQKGRGSVCPSQRRAGRGTGSGTRPIPRVGAAKAGNYMPMTGRRWTRSKAQAHVLQALCRTGAVSVGRYPREGGITAVPEWHGGGAARLQLCSLDQTACNLRAVRNNHQAAHLRRAGGPVFLLWAGRLPDNTPDPTAAEFSDAAASSIDVAGTAGFCNWSRGPEGRGDDGIEHAVRPDGGEERGTVTMGMPRLLRSARGAMGARGAGGAVRSYRRDAPVWRGDAARRGDGTGTTTRCRQKGAAAGLVLRNRNPGHRRRSRRRRPLFMKTGKQARPRQPKRKGERKGKGHGGRCGGQAFGRRPFALFCWRQKPCRPSTARPRLVHGLPLELEPGLPRFPGAPRILADVTGRCLPLRDSSGISTCPSLVPVASPYLRRRRGQQHRPFGGSHSNPGHGGRRGKLGPTTPRPVDFVSPRPQPRVGKGPTSLAGSASPSQVFSKGRGGKARRRLPPAALAATRRRRPLAWEWRGPPWTPYIVAASRDSLLGPRADDLLRTSDPIIVQPAGTNHLGRQHRPAANLAHDDTMPPTPPAPRHILHGGRKMPDNRPLSPFVLGGPPSPFVPVSLRTAGCPDQDRRSSQPEVLPTTWSTSR